MCVLCAFFGERIMGSRPLSIFAWYEMYSSTILDRPPSLVTQTRSGSGFAQLYPLAGCASRTAAAQLGGRHWPPVRRRASPRMSSSSTSLRPLAGHRCRLSSPQVRPGCRSRSTTSLNGFGDVVVAPPRSTQLYDLPPRPWPSTVEPAGLGSRFFVAASVPLMSRQHHVEHTKSWQLTTRIGPLA